MKIKETFKGSREFLKHFKRLQIVLDGLMIFSRISIEFFNNSLSLGLGSRKAMRDRDSCVITKYVFCTLGEKNSRINKNI